MKIRFVFVNWVHLSRKFGTNLCKESLDPREIVNTEALKEGFRPSMHCRSGAKLDPLLDL